MEDNLVVFLTRAVEYHQMESNRSLRGDAVLNFSNDFDDGLLLFFFFLFFFLFFFNFRAFSLYREIGRISFSPKRTVLAST